MVSQHIQSLDLTFFAWTDTHFGYNPQFAHNDHRWRAMQQMCLLPDWPYPAKIGGYVGTPDFILHCGDFVTDGGRGEEVLAYYLHCIKQTDIPSFEVLGNHDVAYPNVIDYFVQKHGGKYYSFDRKGVHFIGLYQTFTESEQVKALDSRQLQWLEKDLSEIDSGVPVVLFSHDRLDSLPNADEVDSILNKVNIIFMLSGHLHDGTPAYTWNGRTGMVIGHCRDVPEHDPISGRRIIVVKITQSGLVIAPWRWDLEEWASSQGMGKGVGIDAEEFVIKSLGA